MVEKPISINAIKKEPFTGSESGMRYRFEKADDFLKTSVYPEPFAFEKTDPEKIITKDFEFSYEIVGTIQDLTNKQALNNLSCSSEKVKEIQTSTITQSNYALKDEE